MSLVSIVKSCYCKSLNLIGLGLVCDKRLSIGKEGYFLLLSIGVTFLIGYLEYYLDRSSEVCGSEGVFLLNVLNTVDNYGLTLNTGGIAVLNVNIDGDVGAYNCILLNVSCDVGLLGNSLKEIPGLGKSIVCYREGLNYVAGSELFHIKSEPLVANKHAVLDVCLVGERSDLIAVNVEYYVNLLGIKAVEPNNRNCVEVAVVLGDLSEVVYGRAILVSENKSAACVCIVSAGTYVEGIVMIELVKTGAVVEVNCKTVGLYGSGGLNLNGTLECVLDVNVLNVCGVLCKSCVKSCERTYVLTVNRCNCGELSDLVAIVVDATGPGGDVACLNCCCDGVGGCIEIICSARVLRLQTYRA